MASSKQYLEIIIVIPVHPVCIHWKLNQCMTVTNIKNMSLRSTKWNPKEVTINYGCWS